MGVNYTGSWQISTINEYTQSHWLIVTQFVGFLVALIGLMGKLEMPPFDAPEAETEIVAGALTEYSGRVATPARFHPVSHR
ncbi:MAG: NADH-quinone oxidoreductase subunit H [Candidatus Promineifilaceae bacterium]